MLICNKEKYNQSINQSIPMTPRGMQGTSMNSSHYHNYQSCASFSITLHQLLFASLCSTTYSVVLYWRPASLSAFLSLFYLALASWVVFPVQSLPPFWTCEWSISIVTVLHFHLPVASPLFLSQAIIWNAVPHILSETKNFLSDFTLPYSLPRFTPIQCNNQRQRT